MIESIFGGVAWARVPLQWTPPFVPIGVAGAAMLTYWRPLPLTSGVTVRSTLAGTLPKLETLAVQWLTPVLAEKDVGSQLWDRVTAPCFFTNATGMVTGVPVFGVRVMRPKYWPLAASGALIVTQKVRVLPLLTLRVVAPAPGPLGPGAFLVTTMRAPAGFWTETWSDWFLPDTLSAVRLVVIWPVIVVASMLAMLRSIRWIGSAPAATKPL